VQRPRLSWYGTMVSSIVRLMTLRIGNEEKGEEDPPKRLTKRKTGRPSLLTHAVHSALLREVRLRGFLRPAAIALGLSPNTVEEWVRRGQGSDSRPADPQYANFATDIARAREEGIGRRLKEVQQSAKGGAVVERVTETRPDGSVLKREKFQVPDWRAAAWYLERADPERYGSRRTMNVQGPLTVKHVDALADGVLRILRRFVPQEQREGVAVEVARVVDEALEHRRIQIPGPIRPQSYPLDGSTV